MLGKTTTLYAILLTIIVCVIGQVKAQSCDDLDCDICCRPSSPAICLNDTNALDCQMQKNENLDSLLLLLTTFIGFLLGKISVFGFV